MSIKAIAAVARNLAIGKDNNLLWRLPNDLKFFKNQTQGHTVLMGRKSFESIGRPLPNRRNWVLTRQKDWKPDGVEIFHSWEAIKEALGNDDLFIIGGGEIYQQSLALWDTLYLTEVDTEVLDADAFFPVWNADNSWVLEWEEAHKADEKHAFDYTFKRYKNSRVNPL